MDHDTTAWTRISGYVARVAAGLSRPSVLLIVGGLSAGLLWVIAVTPTAVAFAFAVGLAAAWCVWLERHPEATLGSDG